MSGAVNYSVMIFKSVSQVMQAEKILKNTTIPFKLIPVPKVISSECGICIRFEKEYAGRIIEALSGKVEYSDLREL